MTLNKNTKQYVDEKVIKTNFMNGNSPEKVAQDIIRELSSSSVSNSALVRTKLTPVGSDILANKEDFIDYVTSKYYEVTEGTKKAFGYIIATDSSEDNLDTKVYKTYSQAKAATLDLLKKLHNHERYDYDSYISGYLYLDTTKDVTSLTIIRVNYSKVGSLGKMLVSDLVDYVWNEGGPEDYEMDEFSDEELAELDTLIKDWLVKNNHYPEWYKAVSYRTILAPTSY